MNNKQIIGAGLTLIVITIGTQNLFMALAVAGIFLVLWGIASYMYDDQE